MSCFFSHAGRTAIPALLSVALAAAACNKDGEITLPDSKPRITLDSETGVYAAKIGRAVTITPTVENEGEAAYSWTIDDEVVSTARVFEYVFNEEGRVYVTLRVENRAGYDEKEARIDVNRLAPPVISLIVPQTGYTCSRDGNTRSHRRCRTAKTPVTNGIWTTRPYRSPPKRTTSSCAPNRETAPCG